MKNHRLLITLFLVAYLFPISKSQAQDIFFERVLKAKDIDLTLGTDWYGLYLQSKKIGTCKIERARAGDTIVETFAMNMKAVAFEKKTEMQITRLFTFEAKPPYRLLKATLDQSDGSLKTKISATRAQKGFDYVLAAPGKERNKQVAEPAFSLADNFSPEVWLRSAPKVGDKVLVRDLDLEDWKLDPTRLTVKAIKTSLVGGVEVKYYEVETESRKNNFTYLSRFDSTGKMLSSNLAIFELRKETEEQAKNTEFSQELFVLGMVKIDRKIGRTTQLTELQLEVEGKEGDILKDGPRQRIVAGKEGG